MIFLHDLIEKETKTRALDFSHTLPMLSETYILVCAFECDEAAYWGDARLIDRKVDVCEKSNICKAVRSIIQWVSHLSIMIHS